MEIALALLTSRTGQIALAFLIGSGLGWWKTDAGWRRYEKQQQAAQEVLHQMELAREAQNAVEIAKAATQRVEEDADELTKLQKQVSDFDRGEADGKNPCVIDDKFGAAADRLRFNPKPRRPARVTQPPK